MTGPLSPPGAVAAERKGVWERLFDSWVLFFFLVLIINPVLQSLFGPWRGAAVAIPLVAVCGTLLWRARNRQRRERLGRIAVTTGSFEGWLRHPNALPDSLRRRWAYGTFRLDGDTLVFQLRTEADGPELGRPTTYKDVSRLGVRDVPTKEAGVPKSWPVLALATDRGEIEARIPPEGVAVLATLTQPSNSVDGTG